MAAKLDLDALANSANSKIQITGAHFKGFVGYTIGEFRFGGSNTFNSPFDSQSGSLETAQQIATLTGKSVQLKNVNQTVAFWTASNKPEFTIDMIFIAYRSGLDPRKNVAQLIKAVYPASVSESGEVFGKKIVGGLIAAPLRYSLKGGVPQNTVTLLLGSWFAASGLLIKSVDFAFSREIVEGGFPLYAQGNVAFEAARQVSAGTVAGYIKQ